MVFLIMQSNSDAIEKKSNSSLAEYCESSIAHIDLTEECGTILDADDPPQLSKCQQRNKRRRKCHRQAQKARMAKLRVEESTLIERPVPPEKAKRAAQLLPDAVEHTSICTIKDHIVATEEPPEVTHISHGPESQLKDVLFQTFNLKEKKFNIIPGIETPHVQPALYPAKWDRPIKIIAFMDTGATTSILNTTALPNEQWIPHFQKFNTVSKGIRTTRVITKNFITKEFFPGVQYRTKLLGSIILGTDLLIGFDIYKQLNDRIKEKTQGIAFRDKFKPYTTTTRLFPIMEDKRVKNMNCQLVEESCADSHREFLKKHDKPLWLNEEFFIRLPFKRNESINATRERHYGMNPEHLQLVKKKYDELLEYRLIVPSDSQWSSENFYFNK
ncbi:hypothetical protein H5410_046621 [Solanum commersonii]|uniref:Uncharacterized protein n=1 Tax=Solanum commersonii TaxID=4109 RepID=A0A9J5XCS2_SOLCO|nr:hypothetical protein H5410_046621 [Solanum commersonii]